MRLLKLFIISGVFLPFLSTPPVSAWAKSKKQTPSQTTVVKSSSALEEKIDALDQNQKVLERKWELQQEKVEEKSKDSAIVTANKDGFSIRSADKAFQLKIRGYAQTDGRFFLGDTGDKLANQFVLRRVRPIIEGTLYKYFDFRVMPDFGEGKTVLQDAYADIHPFTWLRLRAGKFKEPVGLERLQSGSSLTFIERGLPTALVPNRDLGFQLHGEVADGIFQYAAGFFNGVLDGGSVDGDTSDGKDFAGRIFTQPFKKTTIAPLQGLGIGVGGSYGDQKGSATATNLPSYKSIGQNTVFSFRSDGTAPNTVIAAGERNRLSPQGYYYWGPFGLLGEYVISSQRVNLAGNAQTLTHKAWQVAPSYVLTGEKASYNGVVPKNPINPKKGHWGAVELAALYNELKLDPDTFPTFADPAKSVNQVRAWGAGVNWYLNKNLKLQVNYDESHFEGGKSSGNRNTERALFTRLQVAY